jgi:hypothetical protein
MRRIGAQNAAESSSDGESIMEIVNGVPCFNCTDVEKAKKSLTEPAASSTSQISLQQNSARSFASPNAPLGAGPRGTQVNFGT